jgi:hypothetical protein
MKLNLPKGTNVRGVTFGTPRVGNEAWATFFDSRVIEFTRMNNRHDPVPTVPGRLLGFSHPRTEIHIEMNGHAVLCPGGVVLRFRHSYILADFFFFYPNR